MDEDLLTDIDSVIVKFRDGTVAQIDGSAVEVGLTIRPRDIAPEDAMNVLLEDIYGMARGYEFYAVATDTSIKPLSDLLDSMSTALKNGVGL